MQGWDCIFFSRVPAIPELICVIIIRPLEHIGNYRVKTGFREQSDRAKIKEPRQINLTY